MTLVDRPFLWIRSCAFCYRFSLFTRILPAVAFIPTCDGQAHGQTVYGSRHRQPHWRIPRGHDQTGLYRRFIGLSQIVTGNQSLHKGFEAGLDFLERIGIDTITARIKTLGDRLRTGLVKIDGVTIQSSIHDSMCAGITNFAIRGWDGQKAVLHLYKMDKIMPRAAVNGIRLCLHIYNSFDDVDRALARVAEMAAKPPTGG